MMVTKYVALGMPTRKSDKRVPWPEARDWHAANVASERSGNYHQRSALNGHGGAPGVETIASLQRDKLRAEVALKCLMFRERRRELIPREVFHRAVEFMCATTRQLIEKILSLPGELAATCAEQSDALEIERLWRENLERVIDTADTENRRTMHAAGLRIAGVDLLASADEVAEQLKKLMHESVSEMEEELARSDD